MARRSAKPAGPAAVEAAPAPPPSSAAAAALSAPPRPPRSTSRKHLSAAGLLALITFIHLSGLYLFTRGFLLTRLSLSSISKISEHAPPPTHSKALVLIIDSLRFDFLVPPPLDHPSFDPSHHGVLSLPQKLAIEHPEHALLFHSYADPPTTTLQRLKGLTTGSLPTFVDIGSAFSCSKIEEDSLILQLKRANRSSAFMGDDTWMSVFPDGFDVAHPYDSFNVEDLHSVDDGVERHLFPLITNASTPVPDFVVGHFLGADHVGHRLGPSHPVMKTKLEQMNDVLSRVIELLDEDTLLVLLGDHGMDAKGDHGGDGALETSAALFLYSRSKPLTTRSVRAAAATERPHYSGPTSPVPHRTIAQIDLVPSLSLLLGLPIPYNNLGSIIPELFPAPANLRQAQRANAEQVMRYLDEYLASVSGAEIRPFHADLKELHDAGENESFVRIALERCRAIWAQFDQPQMLAGLAVLALSVPVLAGLFIRTGNGEGLDWVDDALKRAAAAGGAAAAALLGAAFARGQGKVLEAGLLGGSLGAELALLISYPPVAYPSSSTLLALVLAALHVAAFASNSYILWEDRVVLVLLQTPTILSLLRAPLAPSSRLCMRLLGFSALLAVSLRALASSTVCREELAGWCHVTFYGSSTSSIPPLPVLLLLLPAAFFLSRALQAFLDISKSYAGVAPLFLGHGFRAALLAGSVYWLLDWTEGAEAVALTDNGRWLVRGAKTVLARMTMGLVLVVGYTLWYYAPLCIEIKSAEAGASAGVGEGDAPAESKPSVVVLGWANSFGSSYLLFLAPFFALLWLVNLPTGQLVLAVGLISILAYLEIVDSTRDELLLRRAFTSPTAFPDNEQDASLPGTLPPTFGEAAFLAQLGFLLFFATGHQSVLQTIQWKTAFVGFPTLTYPFAPVLVALNTLGPFVLTALAVPLLTAWNVSPRPGQAVPVLQHTLRAALAFSAYHTAVATSAAAFAAHFRRHLMVWKVFAPRFMVGGVTLLAADVGLVLAVGVGVAVVARKVKSTMNADVA